MMNRLGYSASKNNNLSADREPRHQGLREYYRPVPAVLAAVSTAYPSRFRRGSRGRRTALAGRQCVSEPLPARTRQYWPTRWWRVLRAETPRCFLFEREYSRIGLSYRRQHLLRSSLPGPPARCRGGMATKYRRKRSGSASGRKRTKHSDAWQRAASRECSRPGIVGTQVRVYARPCHPRWVAIFGIIASPAERAKVAEW